MEPRPFTGIERYAFGYLRRIAVDAGRVALVREFDRALAQDDALRIDHLPVGDGRNLRRERE